MSWPNLIVEEKLIFHAGYQVLNYPVRVNDPIELPTLTSLIKGHALLFFSRKKSSLPSDFHVID